jgi:ABC-2 type transport system permease protein
VKFAQQEVDRTSALVPKGFATVELLDQQTQHIAQAQSSSQEVHNASIAIADKDHSELSVRIAHAFLPPYIQTPQPIAERDIVPLMNAGKYTFIVDIPPNFARDVLARRQPAPAECRCHCFGTGRDWGGLRTANHHDGDRQFLIESGKSRRYRRSILLCVSPSNVETSWFISVMGIINSITMLAIVLAGAAVVREREHGTMGPISW